MSRNLMVFALGLGWAGLAVADPPSISTGEGTVPDGLPSVGDVDGLPGEGSEDPPSAFIVAGEVAGPELYPNVVALEMSLPENEGGGESTCTGSLIHPNWVLTAAHCVDKASAVRVRFGGDVRTDVQDLREADYWEIHPDWNENAEELGDFDGDVAVIRLASPKNDILPMALNEAEVNRDWLGTPLTFVGFGITEWQGTGSGTKRFATDVPIVRVKSEEILAGNGYSGTCQGDSGGPGLRRYLNGYVQVSVTSYGRVCGDNESGHKRVDAYLDWIRAQMFPDEFVTRPSAPPSFRCSHELDPGSDSTVAISIAPFDLKCVVDYYAPDQITSVDWTWGDGGHTEYTVEADGTEAVLEADHTYTTAGNFALRMCASGVHDPENGENATPWEHCVRRSGYVRSCGVPEVEFSWDGVRGRTFQFVNRTDLSVYGCIFNVQWDIYAGDTVSGEPMDSVSAWAPQYTFDEPGDYTVVLNVGGLAGTGAAQALVTVKASNNAGTGTCSQGAGVGAGLGLLGLVLVGLRRRREDA